MLEVTYTLHIEPGEDHGYIAWFPALPGCRTQANDLAEVLVMARDALRVHLKSLQKSGREIPAEISLKKQIGFDLPVSVSIAR